MLRYRLPKNAENPRMRAGMIFTIEPMINLGSHETELDEHDGNGRCEPAIAASRRSSSTRSW